MYIIEIQSYSNLLNIIDRMLFLAARIFVVMISGPSLNMGHVCN